MEPLPKERSDRCRAQCVTSGYVASMEPLPKERSDAPDPARGPCGHSRLNGAAPEGAERHVLPRRGYGGSCSLNGAAPEGAERHQDQVVQVGEHIKPQWSHSRRSGATTGNTFKVRGGYTPQWSRSRRSGATAPPGHGDRIAAPASMEPLPKERSNVLYIPIATTFTTAASMEPLPKERSDGQHRRDQGQARAASMEPLPKERSDRDPTCAAGRPRPSLNGAAPEGAERRPWEADIIGDKWQPQWSRSRRSGATCGSIWACPVCSAPQWSRSRRSGATNRASQAAR